MTPALLLSALLAAAPAAALAAAPAATSSPILKDGVEITIQPARGGSHSAVTQVGLDIEATTDDAATRFGFHSLHAVADVDCAQGLNRFVSAQAYDQRGFGGAGRSRAVTGAWVAPTADSFMAPVLARICVGQNVAAAGPPPVVKEMAQPAPAKVSAPPSARAQPTAGPLPVVRALPPTAPAPQAAAPAGAPQVASQAAPQPAPDAAPPSAPPPTSPLVVKMGAPTQAAVYAPSAPAAPQTASYIPKVAGDRVAQVAASASQQDAEKVLRQLKHLIEPPLTTTIEQAVVGTAHVYRADVVGFQTAEAAKAFCRSAAQWSKTCWVRAKAPAPTAAKPPAEHLRAAKRAG